MAEINEREFLNSLNSEGSVEFSDLIIHFNESTNVNLNKVSSLIKFKNCKFSGARVDFTNPNLDENSKLTHTFSFDDCEFENDVFFKDCFLQEITFLNISKPIKYFHIAAQKIGYCSFRCANETTSNINIYINKSFITEYIEFLNLKSSGKLLIHNSIINKMRINNSAFKQVDITNSEFKNDFQFTRNLIEYGTFKFNEFDKTNFSNSDFGINTSFSFNDFNGTALFKGLKNENKTRVEFDSCNFIKYTYFNNSTLYYLHIDTCKFQESASFQELKLNFIVLDRTIFEKTTFFDNIVIIGLNKCDKRTIRNIKQQLLRADNKIDYDNFRAHELNSYKEELKNKIKLKHQPNRKKLRRDLTILRVNSFFSNNGTDWVKALKRTLFVAVLFYSIFYAIHNSSKELDVFNTSNYIDYFNGLFRYFLITDFYNPLVSNREYLSNPLEWIPFILGKILIAIGIYEILISFRKFKK